MILFLAPTSKEYKLMRSALQSRTVLKDDRIKLVQCGVGQVNAAYTTALETQCEVDAIVVIGFAGASQHYKIGDIVAPKTVIPVGVSVPPTAEFAEEITSPRSLQGSDSCVCFSGNYFVTSAIENKINKENVSAIYEMESYAVAQVVSDLNIPVSVVKMVSDVPSVHKDNFETYSETTDMVNNFTGIVEWVYNNKERVYGRI